MRTPFKKEEIQQVVKTLKNGKSPGIDKITAEYIKYAPDTIHEVIADIFMEIAEKGNDVEELIIGILNPLQKPNKKQGPPAHLRSIILLSILRKILTICVMNRIWNRLSTNISAEQAPYQKVVDLRLNKYLLSNNSLTKHSIAKTKKYIYFF